MNAKVKYTLALVCLFFALSCTPKEWYNITDSYGNTFIGTWYKLTEIDGKSVIYTPSDANNMEIRISKEKKEIFIKYGIEDVTFEIDKIDMSNDEFIFTIKNSENKITCKIFKDSSVWFIPNNITVSFTNTPNKYPHITDIYMNEKEKIKNDIEEFALNNLYIDISKQGFKQISLDKFEFYINHFFNISDTINNIKISNHKLYFTYLIEQNCNDKELLKSEFDYFIPNIIFSKSNLYITDIETLLEYINPDENKDFLLKRCFYRNSYLFYDSKASLTWLINNDITFINILLLTFGYDKESKINEFVLKNISQEIKKKMNNVHYNYSDCERLLYTRDCNGKLKINTGVLTTLKDITNMENKEYLDILVHYLININAGSLQNDLSDEEKIQLYCIFGRAELDILKKYPYIEDGTYAHISWLLTGYQDKYKEIARQNNYWGIVNFDDIEKVVEWEYTIANEGEEKESFDYTILK